MASGLSLRSAFVVLVAASGGWAMTLGACGGFEGGAAEEDAANGDGATTNDATIEDANDSSVVDASSPPKFCGDAEPCRQVFVTSSEFQGALGTISGGNSKCSLAAADAGRPGTWTAWLSAGTASGIRRQVGPGTWFIGTEEAVRISPDASADIEASRSVNIDERGVAIRGGVVWTGTSDKGTPFYACSSWQSSDAGDHGTVGDLTQSGTRWNNLRTQGCNEYAHLYCFQTGN